MYLVFLSEQWPTSDLERHSVDRESEMSGELFGLMYLVAIIFSTMHV